MPAHLLPTPLSRSALAGAFLISTLGPLSAAVTDWEFQKGPGYFQFADDVQPTVEGGWFVYVAVCAAPGDAASATISGGGIAGTLPLAFEDGEWFIEEFYGSQAAMNAVFPSSSSYTLTLSGGTLGTVSQTFAVGAANYPAIPYLTGVDLSRAVNIEAVSPFTFHFNSPGPNGDFVYFEFEDKAGLGAFFDGPEVTTPATSATMAGNTLPEGGCFEANLGFDNEETIPADPAGFNTEGFVFHSRVTIFDVFTILDREPEEIVGAWQFGDGNANVSGVLVFQEDGTYFHAEDGDDQPGDPDGMERGTYTWDDISGILTATQNVDTNGGLGLSLPVGMFTAFIDGSTMTLADAEQTDILHRVASVTSPIEGGWRICDGGTNDTGVLVFLANGSYFHAEVDDPGGMERGTYSWDPGTEVLTATPAVDTNGTLGLSDPAGGTFDATVFGMKVLTLFEAVGSTSLYRVTNAAVKPEWRIVKGPLYLQTADNSPGTPIDWCAFSILQTLNPGDAGAVALSGGNLPADVALVEEDPGHWEFESIYPSEAALDAEFPSNSNYTLTISGGELGTITQELPFGAKAYPNVPFLTGTNLSEAGEINPVEPFPVTWNDPGPLTAANGITAIEIFEDLGGGDEGDQFYRDRCDGVWTTTTVPALTLPAGRNFLGFIEATNADPVFGDGGFGPPGVTSHNTSLDFPMTTLGGAGIAESAAEDAGLTGADALPDAEPFDDGISNLLKFAFNLDLGSAGGGALEGGTGTSGLPAFEFDQSVPDPVVKIEFVQRKGAGLVYTPKRSTTLGGGSFTPITGSVTVTPIDENFDRVVVEDPCDPDVVPKCFWTIDVGYE
ncbi:MAG: hypothetical protein HKO57_17645 [Akkermansiaceae bacterium]|nr:hypothetical protein [Akkermansiaceae bacterium]